MRSIMLCLVIGLGWCTVAKAVTLRTPDPNGRFVRGPTQTGPYPFYFLFDVNGVERRLDTQVYSRLIYDTDTGIAQPIKIRDRTIDELIGFSDGGRFKIVIFPMSHPRGSEGGTSDLQELVGNPRHGQYGGEKLFYQVFRWVDDGVGENFGFSSGTTLSTAGRAAPLFDLEGSTEPMIIQSAELLDPDVTGRPDPTVLLRGASGPRFVGDTVLFSRVVGGEAFAVRLKEFGFGDWGDVVVSIPEPSSASLLSLAVTGLWIVRRRGTSSRPAG